MWKAVSKWKVLGNSPAADLNFGDPGGPSVFERLLHRNRAHSPAV